MGSVDFSACWMMSSFEGFKQMIDLDGLAFFDALDQHGDGADDAVGSP